MDSCITDVDIALMLEPIAEDKPILGDLRDNIVPDSSYQRLRSVRTAARNNERAAQNEGETVSINLADWKMILDDVPDILINESKDIELVAWYIEALTRQYGFLGVAKGFSLARQLISAYGEQLYPRPDEDGLISQLSSLGGLNGFGSEGSLIYPIKCIVLTEGDVPGPLPVWRCEQVLEADRISDPEKREARFRQNGITRAQLDEILNETSTTFLKQVQQHIQLAIKEYAHFQQVLDEYCHDDPMPTGQIKTTLENAQKILMYIAGDRLAELDVVEDVEEADSDAETVIKTTAAASGPIVDRGDALQRLQEVANFFRRTEPHSPISYSIEQAVRWSGLPLTELIKELIPDDSARTKYQNLSGIGLEKSSD